MQGYLCTYLFFKVFSLNADAKQMWIDNSAFTILWMKHNEMLIFAGCIYVSVYTLSFIYLFIN